MVVNIHTGMADNLCYIAAKQKIHPLLALGRCSLRTLITMLKNRGFQAEGHKQRAK